MQEILQTELHMQEQTPPDMTTTDAMAFLNSNGKSAFIHEGSQQEEARGSRHVPRRGFFEEGYSSSQHSRSRACGRARTGRCATDDHRTARSTSSGSLLWSYHHTQIDESNKFQSKPSAVVRRNFQELLLGDRTVYRDHFAMVSRMNPAIAGAIRDHTVSRANMPRYERARSLFGYQDDSGASDTEEKAAVAGVAGFARFGREPRCDVRRAQNHSRSCEFIIRCDVRRAQNHSRSCEFIMSMMQRWYNMHSHCFLLYSFSCILFATGASSIVRGLLLSMRIVYSKRRRQRNRTFSTTGLPLFDYCGCVLVLD